jgi:hypothetical protein
MLFAVLLVILAWISAALLWLCSSTAKSPEVMAWWEK